MKGFYSFYYPDLSYDAFVLENNKWILHPDVIGVNDEHASKKQTVYVMNEKTGKLEKREIKSKWINPEDPSAPVGGSEHVAVTPDSVEDDKNKKSGDPKEPKINKKDKRDPSHNSLYDDVNKKKRKKKRRKRN